MIAVVPLVGTWIETAYERRDYAECGVVPLVGTWIETDLKNALPSFLMSFPSWERGLKLRTEYYDII